MTVQITQLIRYPVKSCAGHPLTEVEINERGLSLDRQWMLVDENGQFVSQRTDPSLTLVKTRVRFGELTLTAPGMLRLDIPAEVEEDDDSVVRDATVWQDTVRVVDEGDLVASWFSRYLDKPVRLVKQHPLDRRMADAQWLEKWDPAAPLSSPVSLADGFPLLVANQVSLDQLNERLAQRGQAPANMDRFRPNIVLSGLDAFVEDQIRGLRRSDGLTLALVKPCTRCSIPNVDPNSGTVGAEPGTTLSGFRVIEPLGICFGVNAVLQASGQMPVLRVGDEFEAI